MKRILMHGYHGNRNEKGVWFAVSQLESVNLPG